MTEDGRRLIKLLEEIHRIKANDPNVNLFIGVLENDSDKVRQAVDDGANVHITDSAVIEYHRPLLLKQCRRDLEEWEAHRRQGSDVVQTGGVPRRLLN